MSEIKVIALTGGPCAGKSTGLAYLRQKLEELGCAVIITQEAPTDLMVRGLTAKQASTLFFQREVGERMIYDLTQAKRFAEEYQRTRPEQKVVILCDRGLADIRAYTPKEEYERLLYMWRVGSHEEMKQNLYDCVVHMVTAADGAEEHYTLLNNTVRLEGSVIEARDVDKRTQKAWIGHQHFFVVDNSTSFEKKLHRVLQHICNDIGLPSPLEIERKFLVEAWDSDVLQKIIPRINIDIAQAYTPQKGERVRERIVNRTVSYFHTVKYPAPGGGNVEYERLMTKDEFRRFVSQYELTDRFLKKRRHSFVANGRHFELDVFEKGGLVLLECELPSVDEVPVVPYFIKVDREVTDDPFYSNFQIWKRQFA